METFADYILSEHDYVKKLEIVFYMKKREAIFFDGSVLLKTDIIKGFVDQMKIDVDRSLILTAGLLCNCKKPEDQMDMSKIKTYAKEGAHYLATLGFDRRFCKICEEVNRYSESMPREPESDILELADILGGLLLDRPERRGFPMDEAMTLLEYRALKDKENRYLEMFKNFIAKEEGITI